MLKYYDSFWNIKGKDSSLNLIRYFILHFCFSSLNYLNVEILY